MTETLVVGEGVPPKPTVALSKEEALRAPEIDGALEAEGEPDNQPEAELLTVPHCDPLLEIVGGAGEEDDDNVAVRKLVRDGLRDPLTQTLAVAEGAPLREGIREAETQVEGEVL